MWGLFEKLAIVGRDLLLKSLPDYLSGALVPVPQNPDEATFLPISSPKKNSWIGPNQPASSLQPDLRHVSLASRPYLLAGSAF